MKTSLLMHCLILTALTVGCHRETGPEAFGEPKVNGDMISFPTNSPQLASLDLARVEEHTTDDIQLPGRLVWNENLTVRVFTPFAGRVRNVLADIGQRVQQNEPLANVESPDFGQAQADARKAESDLKLAERNLARLHELYDHGAAARKDLEAAEDAQSQAQAEHLRALSKIAAYGASADSLDEVFVLRSAVAGTVVDKSISPGEEIRPDQMLANMPEITAPLFVVSDPTHLWIQIDAAEIDLSRLKSGRDFTFTTRAYPGEIFTGRVDKVSEFIDPNTRTVKVRGTVENPHGLLRAEMFVSVQFPDEVKTALSVPAAAVFLHGEKHFVFVKEQPGLFARQEVAIGSEQAGRVLIVSGLQTGQQVVTDGCVLLQQLVE